MLKNQRKDTYYQSLLIAPSVGSPRCARGTNLLGSPCLQGEPAGGGSELIPPLCEGNRVCLVGHLQGAQGALEGEAAVGGQGLGEPLQEGGALGGALVRRGQGD